MPLSIPVVWTDPHRLHNPEMAIRIGVPIPSDELPERTEAIRTALTDAGAKLVPAEHHSYDAELVEFLRTEWGAWQASDLPVEPGQPNVVGYIHPTPRAPFRDRGPTFPRRSPPAPARTATTR